MISDMVDLVDSDIAPGQTSTKATVSRLLSLAAAPTFAIMALFTAGHRRGMADMICAAAPDGSPLAGMIPMYLLMSAFHLPPWFRLLSSHRRGTPRP